MVQTIKSKIQEMTKNKQQTAVQEHITWLKEQLQECIDGSYSDGWISAYKLAIKHAELMLEQERVQAINLYYQYEKYAMITESVIMTFGQFYKQTYGGDEK
jgi:hypothetical protein